MKILLEDRLFARIIKYQDGLRCQRCGTKHKISDKGFHCSHFWSRRHWGTRYDKENCDALCYGCHSLWEDDKQGEYKDFKIKQLGIKRYKTLEKKARINTLKINILTKDLRKNLKLELKKYETSLPRM